MGNIAQYNKSISNLTKIQIKKLNIKKNQFTSLQFSSGIKVSGYISNILKKENKIIIITFYECYVKYKSEILCLECNHSHLSYNPFISLKGTPMLWEYKSILELPRVII